jgi:arylformamidase
MVLYDISQTLEETIAVWPGDQKFRRRWSMRIDRGDSCNVSSITMSAHTGTHMDAPCHFDDAGPDIARVPLDACIGTARVVCLPAGHTSVSPAFLQSLSWDGVERILFRTGASEVEESRFVRDFPFLAGDAAAFLAGRSLRLVGTDAPSVDEYGSKTLRSHKLLLAGGIVILEGLRLAGVPPGDYELICLPLKVAGLDGSPVRAVLRSLR